MKKKQLVSLSKSLKIYNILKFGESIIDALIYYSALILSKVFFNFLVNRTPESLGYNLENTIYGRESFYEKVICNVLVKKLQMSDGKIPDLNQNQIYEFWESEGGVHWHNKTNNYVYKTQFAEQSVYIIEKINELTKLRNIKNLCLIDIATGNGNFLDFLTKEINLEIKAIGFDINKTIIEHNKQRDELKHIEFKHGLLHEHADYILNLSKDNTVCFFSRKSLTLYSNQEFSRLLGFLNKIKSQSYFFILETNNFNYKKENETDYRDAPNIYAHNYPLIFRKNNWEIMWSKKRYINIFTNDHWIYCGFIKKNE